MLRLTTFFFGRKHLWINYSGKLNEYLFPFPADPSYKKDALQESGSENEQSLTTLTTQSNLIR